jgi:hypothetical protein
MNNIIKYVIFAIIFAVMGLVGYTVVIKKFYNNAPIQPINFSHKIHAGDNEMPCLYCHVYAERSRHSGAPAVERCMGCHKIIKTDSPEIQKLTKYWDDKEPVPWLKVHNLPDFVYFPHKRHVRAKVDCKECHGDVAAMPVVERVASLKMGWCLKCHKAKEVKNGRDCWTCHM